MKKILLLMLIAFPVINSFAQNQKQLNSGKIIFDITYPESTLDEKTMASLPTESTMLFKNDKAKVEVKMQMGQTTIISDNKTGDGTMLMDMMGKKWAIKMNKGDIQKQKEQLGKPKVEITNETKKIAGYTCKKAVISMKMKDGEKKFDAWFTDALKARNSFSTQIDGLDGFLMEFDNTQNGIDMKMTARSVEAIEVADAEFIIPQGYEVKTIEELRGMGGKK